MVWASIVGRKGQVDVFECGKLGEKIPSSTIKVLARVPWINTKASSCVGHQLPEAKRPLRAMCNRIVATLCLNHRLKQQLPVICGDIQIGKRAIALMTTCGLCNET